jgi:hypothetical protein
MLSSPGSMPGPDTLDLLERTAATARARGGMEDLEQSLVVPERAGKNNVRYLGYDWYHYDFLDDHGVGGVRLYYYPREAEIAQVAAALVREQYELLARKFNYRPTTRVPYILYSSHREFENTNVFSVNQYVLGVTSPLDLRMALPYWGEINLFKQVSTHEMTHQFQIQKMADRADAAGVESPINRLPLWFTEGLAEFYSRDGIDVETDMIVRDLLLNPRPDSGYLLPGFWEDSQPSYVFTYKLGQVRVAFLADQYGDRILQGIIDESPRLSEGGVLSIFKDDEQSTFKGLVGRLVGEKPDLIAQRFSSWLKRRYLPSYLSARQEPPALPEVELEGEPDVFSAAPDGHTILYRTIERNSGRAHLYLADRREKRSAVEVAADGIPGLESLYPVLRSVTAVSSRNIAFLARDAASDGLFIVPYKRQKHGHHVEMEVGARHEIDLSHADILEAGDPTFSPDENRVAFFGLDRHGQIDIWTAEIKTGQLRRITTGPYAERDLNWSRMSPASYGVPLEPGGGHDGTLLFTSDETENHHYNLFALDPATGARRRLTNEPCDERAPYGLGPGRVVFASNAQGRMDLHVLDVATATIKRITDFDTGLTAPTPGPDGLMAVGFYAGQFRVFDVPAQDFLSLDERPAMLEPPAPAEEYPREAIPTQAPRYNPYTLGNWRLETGTATAGTAAFGQGALLFGDILSDRNVLLQFGYFGSLQLTNAEALYFDRSGRQEFGFGLFQNFTEQRDIVHPGFDQDVFYLERQFGGQATWSYPFNAFTRFQLRGTIEGVDRTFLFPVDSAGDITQVVPVEGVRTWNAQRAGYDLQGEVAAVIGYDTTRYQFPLGAAGGGSFLVEVGGGYLPLRLQPYGWSSFDAQYHLKIMKLGVLHFRLASGVAGGSVFGHQFWLSSYDNLRDYFPNDIRLIGNVYAVSNLNFAFPLDWLIRVAFLSNINGVVGLDFGSIAGRPVDLWANRTLDWAFGADLGLGPFEVRLEFADAINLGNGVPNRGWVPNVSLQYAYY